MSEHVRVEKQGAVLAVTLARPDRRNAITVAMYAALADAVEQASGDAWRSGSSPSVVRARTSPPATILPTSSIPPHATAARSRCGVSFAPWPPAKRRWSPRFTAIASGSARRCSSTAISSWPRRQRDSRCPSWISGWCPRRRARCSCRTWLAGDLRRGPCSSPSRSGLMRHCRSASSVTAPPPERSMSRLPRSWTQLLAKPPEALRATQRLLRHGQPR